MEPSSHKTDSAGTVKDATGPRPGVLPQKPTLSVCMIVRDEEKALPRCLRSVQGVADELIVVDTGSKDGTISIAEDFGAKVFPFDWCDDFAAARNQSLKHATGDWVLHVDADEELTAESIPHLRKCTLESEILCYFIRIDNGPRCRGLRFGWNSRLFRNHSRIRYTRPFHESIQPSLEPIVNEEPRWRTEHVDSIRIRHHGYDPSVMQEKWERGFRIMEAYLRENPDDAHMLMYFGGTCCDLGRYDQAERFLTKALGMNPDCPRTNYALALTLQKQRKTEAAIEYYERTIANDPNLAEPLANLGGIYIENGRHGKAVSLLKTALDINPELASGYRYLGLAYLNSGECDQAITELRKAIAIDPNVSSAHINLGTAYTKAGKLNEGIAAYKRALTIGPQDARAHTGLGVAYEKKQMLDKAISHHKKAIDIDPSVASAYINLGTACYMKGMYDEAIAQYMSVLGLDADDADAHANLAITYWRKGDYENAVSHCDEALRLNGSVPEELVDALRPHRLPQPPLSGRGEGNL